MCGLAGIVAPAETPVNVLRAALGPMLAALAHPGPDEEAAVFPSPGVALGHCRLRIIDLRPEAGQPMPNEDGSTWVVFNGEIYNHHAVRAARFHGHTFRSRSDTEVLVHLYGEVADRMCLEIEGMFAFAL